MPGPKEVVLSLDQGTQSTRVYVFDAQCQPLNSHQVALPQIYPEPGWCEHDPMEIWRTAQECISGAMQAAEAAHGPLRVRALGITNQRETTVVWRRSTGAPLHNAIVWLDMRTSGVVERLEGSLGGRDALRDATGLPLSTYFSGVKWLWLLENVPAVAEAVAAGDACMGTVDSWLMWCLTGGAQGGVHVTDVTNASRTQLLDLARLDWHEPALEAFKVPRHVLPRIASNAEVYGHVADGPLAGVPIAGCLGDQMAALLGQRCRPGEAKNTYGTGCFMLLNTGAGAPVSSRHGLLTTLSYQLGPRAAPQYALEGSVAVAGLGISWLVNGLGALGSADESEELAASVADTAGCYLVPAFGGLLAPRWRPDARGALVGLTAATTRGHVVRAMLEAICFQVREVLDAMKADAAGRVGAPQPTAASAAAMASSSAATGSPLDSPKTPKTATSAISSAAALAAVPSPSRLIGSGAVLGVLRVDGGASANSLLMQLQADILQVPVVRPGFRESTSLGAALAAGLAVGMWSEEQLFAGHGVGPTDTFRPEVSRAQAAARYACWNKAVERSLGLAELAPGAVADEPTQHAHGHEVHERHEGVDGHHDSVHHH